MAHDQADEATTPGGDRAAAKPRLVAVCGLPGVGKTTVLRNLARTWKFAYVGLDDLAGALRDVVAESADGEGLLAGARAVMPDLVHSQLGMGVDVAVDAALPHLDSWLALAAAARSRSAPMRIVQLVAPIDIVHERLAARSDAAATFQAIRHDRASLEAMAPRLATIYARLPVPPIVIDGSGTVADTVCAVADALDLPGYLRVPDEAADGVVRAASPSLPGDLPGTVIASEPTT